MTQPKIHKIKVINKQESQGRVTSGPNTQIFIDGEPLKLAKSFKFEVEAGSVAKCTIELYAEVEMDFTVELDQSEPESTGLLTPEGKPVNRYVLSTPYAVAIDIDPGKKYANENGE